MLRLLVVLLFVVFVSHQVSSRRFTGDGTAYTLNRPNNGNCNFMTWSKAAETDYVAMNNVQFAEKRACGRCVKVKCIDSRCTSKREKVVQVLDRCPECKHGDLDLSPSVFKYITGSHPARLTVSWEYVDCPRRKKYICTKGGTTVHWMAIQPVNFESDVKRVTINNELTTFGQIDAYYFQVRPRNKPKSLKNIQVSVELANKKYTSVVSLQEHKCTEFKDGGSVPTTPTPTKRTPTPTKRTPTPTKRTPTPTKRTPTPTKRTPTPTKRTPIPTKKTPTPTKRTPAPTKRTPIPTKRTPTPTKKTPTPTKRTPTPTKRTPTPIKRTPAPTKKTPAPTKRTPMPSKNTPIPTPTKNTPAPTERTPAPTTKTPVPTTRTPIPTKKTPSPTLSTAPRITPASLATTNVPNTNTPTSTMERTGGSNPSDDSRVDINTQSERKSSGVSTAVILSIIGAIGGCLVVALIGYLIVKKKKEMEANATKNNDVYADMPTLGDEGEAIL